MKGAVMMKAILVTMLIAITILNSAPLFAADAAAGKDAYLKKCASCHGQAGEGKDAIAQMLKIKFTPLGSKEVQAKSDADLKKIAIEGMGKMKPVKDLDQKTADDIIAYLRTLKK
jgi:mono/diheme cytochrome c family protein